ncbi:peptidase associated/transthyretin-like domain-containing protein [Niabella aquatica]
MMKGVALLLCTGITGILCAQVTISGNVKSQSGKPLANASIIIGPVNTNKVLAFKMTDSNGQFNLTLQTPLDSVQVKLNLMNHEAETKVIANKTQELYFIAREKATILEEVVVKEAMIYKRGDTIVHDVEQFANKNDRTLADVIKKMPGLEIDEGGKITYQGKDINQFTVEGKDLMQGRYGVIPNSIPYQDISKLEVVANNQPVKMLKDKVPSENAGINLKLKRETTWTGTGGLGLGFSPFLWSVKLTPLLFAKKRQALFNFKSNNTGENILAETGNFIGLSGFTGFSQENSTGNFLNVSSVSPPASIPQSRYWFNISHAVSGNFLQSLKNDWETKANIQYIYHELDLAGTVQTTITNLDASGNALHTVNYARSSELNDIARRLKATLSLNRNAKNNYFKNDLIFAMDRNAADATIWLDRRPAYQKTYSNGFSIQNSLSTILPIDKKSKYLISLQSYINYINDPEWYKVDSLNALELSDADMQSSLSIKQLKRSGTFNTNNSAGMVFTIKDFTIAPAIRFRYANELLNTDLELEQPGRNILQMQPPWLNSLQLENYNAQAAVAINMKKEVFRFSLNLPLSNNSINVQDSENAFARDLNRWLFQPSFFGEVLVKKFTFAVNASRSNRFSTLTTIYPGYVFSALNFNAYQSPIEEAAIMNAGGRVAYKNLLSNIDANAGYSYSHNSSNMMLSTQIASNGQQVTTGILRDNSGNSSNIFFNFGKYMKAALMNIGLGYSYARFETMNLLNDNLFTSVNLSQTASFKMENSYLTWLIGNYSFVYGHSKRTDRGSNYSSASVIQSGRLAFYIFKNGSVNFSGDWNQYTIGGQKFTNEFVDASYRHTLGKRKVDLEIKWMNVLNTRAYEQVVINNIQTNITQFSLRPSQVLLSIRMNLR